MGKTEGDSIQSETARHTTFGHQELSYRKIFSQFSLGSRSGRPKKRESILLYFISFSLRWNQRGQVARVESGGWELKKEFYREVRIYNDLRHLTRHAGRPAVSVLQRGRERHGEEEDRREHAACRGRGKGEGIPLLRIFIEF